MEGNPGPKSEALYFNAVLPKNPTGYKISNTDNSEFYTKYKAFLEIS